MYRKLSENIKKDNGKVTVLLGPRQVGKTTLLKYCFSDGVYINIEEKDYIDIFNSRDLVSIQGLIEREHGKDKHTWILDEVQRLDDPGLIAKVIHDELPHIRLIISGSSALEIANKASESLAGRKKTYHLFPLTFHEYLVQKIIISQNEIKPLSFDLKQDTTYQEEIKKIMSYGLYPETLNIQTNEEIEQYLIELVDSVLLKDIYYLNLIKNTKVLKSLLQLLAYQIGCQINISDIAVRLGVSRQTVFDYIELLKKTYIIYTLSPYTKKRRDEIGKTEKVYFYDLGIRNAIINDFSPVELRKDYGNIFENFVITEIIKQNAYYKKRYMPYYWRTKWGSEVDLVLVKDSRHKAIKIKTRAGSITGAFKETYPDTDEYVVTLENVGSVLLG